MIIGASVKRNDSCIWVRRRSTTNLSRGAVTYIIEKKCARYIFSESAGEDAGMLQDERKR